MGNTSDGASFSGSWSSGAKDFIWMIVAKPTGPKSSHIVLRNYTAKPEELDEVWREIEECGKKK